VAAPELFSWVFLEYAVLGPVRAEASAEP
jgi:hypothetical protein